VAPEKNLFGQISKTLSLGIGNGPNMPRDILTLSVFDQLPEVLSLERFFGRHGWIFRLKSRISIKWVHPKALKTVFCSFHGSFIP
jgi:hypothetical protein